MASTTQGTSARSQNAPAHELPPREDVLQEMLRGTGRGGVPIRSAFVQSKTKHADGSRRGLLASFTTDDRALDAYLLIHALASSKSPYTASYPAIAWAHAAGLDRDATEKSARERWSKAVSKLTRLELISADREGRRSVYTLKHESGDGTPYERPTTLAQGGWVTVPYIYWTTGLVWDLSLSEKIMLLIALDQKATFALPSARVPEWYGVSESTARRGLAGLVKRGVLSADKMSEVDPNSPTLRRTYYAYSTQGEWTHKNRKKAMTVKRRAQN